MSILHNALFQAFNKPQKIIREPYTGPALVSMLTNDEADNGTNGSKGGDAAGEEFYNRPKTQGGGRHMQESSFALSGIHAIYICIHLY